MRHDTSKSMKYHALAAALVAALYFSSSAPLLAAQVPSANKKVPDPAAAAVAVKASEKCMSDLQVFDDKMQKDGHWLGGGSTSYGYPMSGYAGAREGMAPLGAKGADAANNAAGERRRSGDGNHEEKTEASAEYWRARPGYEIRTLIIAANILARRGKQEECEAVLSTTRSIYEDNKADLTGNKGSMTDMSAQQHQQIMSAQSVTSNNASFRSNQLIGTSVVSEQNKSLGSVNDIIMSPKTGKIAYLVIGRGGVFGINEKYVPVPWADFKITADSSLLVLNTNKDTMDGAPQVEEDKFSKNGGFSEQSKKVDEYWKAPQS